jgi:hypothetical protein
VGSNLTEDNGFLRATKICSTNSFRREVKPPVHWSHVVRFYGMLKNPTSMKEILRRQNLAVIFCQAPPAMLLDVSAGY